MNILGISTGHNATICLMQDGKVTFCQSEERLNRIKNSTGFPHLTLDHIYNTLASPDQIDAAVLFQQSIYTYLMLKKHGFRSFQYSQALDPELVTGGLKQRLLKTRFGWRRQQRKIARRESSPRLAAEAMDYFSESLNLPRERILACDHHAAHAWSTIPSIQHQDRTLIFTLDGVGDWKCATVNLYQDGQLRTLDQTDHHHSLGYLYAMATMLLGMKAGEHEFKVMGLAPYARPQYCQRMLEQLRHTIWIDERGRWHSSANPVAMLDTLERIFRYQRFDNVAGAVQMLTEELILRWVHHWIAETGCRRIAVSGGVFMNVKACQLLAESPQVESLFVMPSAADESCAIGCAVWGMRRLAPHVPVAPLRDLYLGMEFSHAQIADAIRQSSAAERYDVRELPDINGHVAQLLAANQIVARCSGRMEFGARALGNRSILAHPANFANLQQINDAIKCRDFWMPFAPSILEEDMQRYVVGHDKLFAPYMCITFASTPLAQRDLVAAIHPRDRTLRPQCVRCDWNSDYHQIISQFKRLTGIGGVLNTSFNLHGEPNVCSPQDAIRTVDQSGLRHLVMGNVLLTKKSAAGADTVSRSHRPAVARAA